MCVLFYVTHFESIQSLNIHKKNNIRSNFPVNNNPYKIMLWTTLDKKMFLNFFFSFFFYLIFVLEVWQPIISGELIYICSKDSISFYRTKSEELKRVISEIRYHSEYQYFGWSLLTMERLPIPDSPQTCT